ncbi:MAG TPA: hypothetical protein DEB39_01875 [Planctomycetaceae bacterium]|nr:hypothetical protein [Planctomycetaceae bacterium]
MKPIPQNIDPRLIRIDLGTQARKTTNENTVREYAEAMEAGAVFPPVTVFFDIAEERYILADGFHRLLAHLKVKPNDLILVEQYLGDVDEAQWYAICANQSHGLIRTHEDKRTAIEMALVHKKGIGKSDNALSKTIGVTQEYTSRVRRAMQAEGRLRTVLSRIGADGRTYNTANIGKKGEEICRCEHCGHYKQPYCMRDGTTKPPQNEACDEFITKTSVDAKKESPDPNHPDASMPLDAEKESTTRVSRRHKGDYVRVPLNRNNTDSAAVEIRHFFGDNYLAALIQSAQKLLRD